MPLIRSSTVGTQIVASAKVSRRFELSVAALGTSLLTVCQLQTNNLPDNFFYAWQTAGAPGCNWQPWIAVDNIAGPLPNWFPLAPAQLLVFGVPGYLSQRVAANMIGMTVTNPGPGVATVTVILCGSQ